MADDNLTISISADTGAAVSGISDLEARLSALEQVYVRGSAATANLTAATTQHTAAQAANSVEARVATEASTGLSGALDTLATHYRMVTAGADAMGIGIEGSAAKVAAFTEVLGGLGSAFPPLLIAMAALAGLFGAFNFFKDAVDQASNMQSELETLGAAVDNQGQSWDAMSASVEKWIDNEAMASGFLRSELVPALNDLVTAGFNVANAEKTLAVAEEVAVAHHKDVREVVMDLIQAESGRAMGLQKLDENLKPLIADHATFSAILKQLHGDNKTQIEDGESNERAWARERVELEAVSLTIGNMLLPLMTNLAYATIGGIEALEHLGTSGVDITESLVDGFKAAWSAVVGLDKAIYDLSVGNLKAVGPDLAAGMKDAGGLLAAAGQLATAATSEYNKAFGDWEKQGRHIAGDAVKAHEVDVSDLSGMNQRVGNVPKGGTGGFTEGAAIPDAFSDEQAAKVIKNLDPIVQLHDKLAASEESVRHAMEMTTSAIDYNAKALELNNLKAQDAITYEKALNDAVASETVTLARDNQARDSSKAVYEQARDAYNTYMAQFPEGAKLTKDQETAEKLLKAAVDATKKSHEDAIKTYDALNATLNTHAGQLNAARLAVEKLGDETTEATAKLTRDWDTFYAKSQQNAENDLRLARSTNAQKFVYYKDLADSITIIDQQTLQQKEAALTAEVNAQKAAVKEMADAYKKYIDDSTKQTASFIDDLIIKHVTLKDELKSIYTDILKQYVDMVSKMIVESKSFGSAFPFTTSTQGGSVSSGGMFGGMLGMFGGTKGGSAPSGRAGDPLHVTTADAGSDYLSKMTGNTTGVSSASAMAILNSASSGSGASGGKTGTSSGTGVSGAAMSALASALGSAGVGGAAATATNGNAEIGAIGGAVGGGLGDMISKLLGGTGPAGLAIGTVLGGLIGGLFGPHETAADQPDLNDPTWGQDVTNWLGGPTTEGNTVNTPSSQYYTANGGTSMMGDVANWVQQNQSDVSSLTQAQQQLYQQMLTLMGGNPNAGTANLGVSESQGIVTFGSGQTMSVADFEGMLTNFNSVVGAGSTTIPTFQVGTPYPNANTSTLTQTGGISSTGINQTPTVTVNVQGNVVGSNGIAELSTMISQAIYEQQNGTLPLSGPSTIYNANGSGF
jgi:hypothetical protein